jgi:hypothetical protein
VKQLPIVSVSLFSGGFVFLREMLCRDRWGSYASVCFSSRVSALCPLWFSWQGNQRFKGLIIQALALINGVKKF